MKIQYIGVGVALFFGLFAFQNCSQNNLSFKATEVTSLGEIEDLGEVIPVSEPPPQIPVVEGQPEVPKTDTPSTPATVQEVADLCQQVGNLKTRRFAVNFPEPDSLPGTQSACAWGLSNNLDPREGFVQARREQIVEAGIPQDAKVCSMKFNFPQQRLEYDDQIILTYRGVVLATSLREYWSVFQKADGLPVYDWLQIKGLKSNITGHSPICLGGQTCIMPATQTMGAIQLSIPNQAFHQIATTMTGMPHIFSLITTGDNDFGRDCRHTGVSFEVEVSYY